MRFVRGPEMKKKKKQANNSLAHLPHVLLIEEQGNLLFWCLQKGSLRFFGSHLMKRSRDSHGGCGAPSLPSLAHPTPGTKAPPHPSALPRFAHYALSLLRHDITRTSVVPTGHKMTRSLLSFSFFFFFWSICTNLPLARPRHRRRVTSSK